MKKLSIVLLSVLLLIVFVGCDLSVETMGKMGKNLAGTDKKYIENIIQQTAPAAAEKKTDEGGTITVAGSNFSISTDGTNDSVSISVGGNDVTIPDELKKAINGVLTDSNFKSIILPTDISDIVLGVKSGSNSETIKDELKNKAKDDSLKAAQGTVTLVNAMLEEVNKAVKDDDPEGGFDEVIEDIKGFLPDKNSITNGDVVVLTALTNIVFNENVLSNIGNIMKKPPENTSGESEEQKNYEKAMNEVSGELMNQFSSLLDVVTNVPSGISDKINVFIDDLMDRSNNKEKAE
ncbi:MAG: hypothetical protein SPF69_02140 [Candidatus Ornithospirochaeta sp.]|nr:hypothetical protein [Sphaerochaetaceae bacterium]MDY5522871.1 hypothetical protein [Candidatus Ornithospirochaeta sp.]